MGPQDRKRTSRLKTWLIFAALAIVAFFPTDMLGASDDDMAGTWTTAGFAPNGAMYRITIRINDGGAGTSTVTVGGQENSSSFRWFLTEANIFCMTYPNGNSECGKVISVGYAALTLANNAGVTTYSRVSSTPSFTGSFHCTHKGCKCPGWAGGNSYSSPCPHKDCGHKYVEHAGPAGN